MEKIMSKWIWEEITDFGLWPTKEDLKRPGRAKSAPSEAQVAICSEWLKLYATPTKTIRKQNTSYGLKHVVEDWTCAVNKSHNRGYVSNGAFIEAARRAGYRIEQTDWMSPNAYFNMKVGKSPSHREIL